MDTSPMGEAPSIPGYGPLTLFARGAQGTLWKSEHLATMRLDAIKITPAAAADPAGIERGQREAVLLARFSGHPNLVSVYGAGTLSNGDFWLSMEYIAGVPLNEEVATRHPLPMSSVRELALGVAEGFATVHAAGILHRDGKPQNVMVRHGSNTAVVIDLAAARPIESNLTKIHNQLAPLSPAWAAPEIHGGYEATVQSEIWSLTAILYFMLAGRKPFAGNAEAVRGQILNAELILPSAIRPEVGPLVDDLVKQGMAKQPHARFATVAEWIRALKQAIPTGSEDSTVRMATSFAAIARPGMAISSYDISVPRWQVILRELLWD